MITRSSWTRSSSFTLLVVMLVLTLGPVGCSSLPRKHWWQFWRKSPTETSITADKMVLPPPPDAAGGLGSGSTLPAPDASQLAANRPIGGQTATVPELRTAYFDYDSDQLTAEAQAVLDGNLAWLQSNSSSEIQLGGHCDARGSTEYNLNLGERRAKSVMAYLVGKGVSANRLHTISYGEENPAVPGDSEEAYAKNRRVEFLVYY
ncbi:MAG: peptidoglycan-associated lipoprotein Pal [Candidatus Sumerlaeia bacterium]